MMETTLVALQDISLEKILDHNGRKMLCSYFTQIMQQVMPSFETAPLPYIELHCKYPWY